MKPITLCLLLIASPAMAAERGPIVLTDHAKQLHASAFVIDGHNDLPWELRSQGSADFQKLDIALPQPTLQTDIPRLRQGGLGGQFWSVWVPAKTARRGRSLSMTLEQIELVRLMIKQYPGDFGLALTVDEMEAVHKSGRIASLIGVEGGHCIEESLGVLEKLYELGARYMTLTHSDTLSWADSATDEQPHGGLTDFGEDVVRKMNQLGMMVDLSHVSRAVMHQALDVSTAPVVFSHSSARAVADHPRNVPDDVLKRLPDEGGVVMVNFFSAFVVPEAVEIYKQRFDLKRELDQKHGDDEETIRRALDRFSDSHPSPLGTIHDVLDHIDHIVKVAGIDHVGLGSDYDGVSLLPKQLEDVSSYPYITQGLIDRGYSDEAIKKVLGGNLLRVFRGVEKTAVELKETAK